MGVRIGQGQMNGRMLRVAGNTGAGDKGRVRADKAKCCMYCGHVGKPKKRFSWPFFFLFCLTGVGGIFYLAYFLLFKRRGCAVCGSKDLAEVRVYASV